MKAPVINNSKRFSHAAVLLFFIMTSILLPLFLPDGITAGDAALTENKKPVHDALLHHALHVVLYPRENRFTAEDTATIPDNFPREFRFILHKGLNPAGYPESVIIENDAEKLPHKHLESYIVRLPDDIKTFVISYGGVIDHPLEQVGKEQARGYSQTMGKITEEGVYLSGHSHWYPVFDAPLLTFSLTVELPREWDVVSQGERTLHRIDRDKKYVRWSSPEPQEEIYLVAGKFHEYEKRMDTVRAMVFLRSPDEKLAGKYLEAAGRYLPLYQSLIGPYPYSKFALVENFWETGFGMPSFTLLGPKVIRLPFIADTSFPHEILHSWWGNSVFPEYEQGNWSEGLTAYLSDHLTAEQRGGGADYRQTALQKYADYVSAEKEFPLAGFRSRHSAPSEAIGYGKSLMFFHMLRLELGDEIFIRGLRDFYRGNKFRFASFGDLRRSFERVSGRCLEDIFAQWITRSGAPELKIRNVRSFFENDSYVLTASVEQVQHGQPYRLLVPVAVTMEGHEEAYQTSLRIDEKRAGIRLHLRAKPLRIDVDPEFDVFRRLNRDEVPPAITLVLGAKRLIAVLPSSAAPPLIQAYRTFAEAMRDAGPDRVEIKFDSEISAFPPDSALCILGMDNLLLEKVLKALSRFPLKMNHESMNIAKSAIPLEGHSIVLTGRNPGNQDAGMLFVSSGSPEALKGLSRKLPHYHKYSYLVFRGDELENIIKGRWGLTDSTMTIFPGENGAPPEAGMGKLHERLPLSAYARGFSAGIMMNTVSFPLATETSGGAIGSQELVSDPRK